ncbi:hypothetical protein CLV59_11280 [Chitinophaga dinghuensis]|uniref:Uncharacterized protein n=1 Tax=Chitinophaga dinghuensis TaxID=1539050 RepID=A0A327VLP8_9BACT|nr:hypothetical protein [Chitinophaga dinghuensis]RAJ73739.1 hypothetical protein CLV59_11280 [Chitinophaga dinghuensis]
MNLIVNVKQLGRKHALIANKTLEIDDIGVNPTLETLILAVVKQQVEAYNQRPKDRHVLPFLSTDEIATQAATGKVDFGINYNETVANTKEAQETALLAFKDGMFAVFADDREIQSLEEEITLESTTVMTFIRLTFLAGSYW